MPKGYRVTALSCAILALSTAKPALSRNITHFDSPYQFRATGQGFLASKAEGSAFLDGMLPIAGNENSMFFVDGLFMQGRDREQVSSLALGVRQKQATSNGDALLGAYVAGDYFNMAKGRSAWLINPGVELLAYSREARLNVYTPVGGRAKRWGSAMASELPQDVIDDSGEPGNNLVRAQGNTFTDTPLALTEELPTGLELEVGQKFAHDIWFRAGAYYYRYKTARHTEGFTFNADVPLNTPGAHLLVMDSIDNQRHNVFSLGLRFDVGDTGLNRHGALSRMTTPLRRHLARVQMGGSVPTRLSYQTSGAAVERDGVLFLAPGGNPQGLRPGATDLGACTVENPCGVITQELIDRIEDQNPNKKLYYFIAKGTYSTNGETLNFNARTNGSSEIWGFSSTEFTHQATGSDRPIINGALYWGDNNIVGADRITSSGTVKNLQVNNQNVTIDVNKVTGGLATIVAVGATGSIGVFNSALSITDTVAPNLYGVFAGNGNLDFVGSSLQVNATDLDTPKIYGLLNINGPHFNKNYTTLIRDSTIDLAVNRIEKSATVNASFNILTGATTVINSGVTVNALNVDDNLYGSVIDSGTGHINMRGSRVSFKGRNAAAAFIYAIRTINNNIDVYDSSIEIGLTDIAKGTEPDGNNEADADGIQTNGSSGNIRLNNSSIRLTINGGDVNADNVINGIRSHGNVTLNNAIIDVENTGEGNKVTRGINFEGSQLSLNIANSSISVIGGSNLLFNRAIFNTRQVSDGGGNNCRVNGEQVTCD